MTARERAVEATWDTGAGDWTTVDREHLEKRVEQAISAAVEEVEDRVANERDSYLENIRAFEQENERLRGLLRESRHLYGRNGRESVEIFEQWRKRVETALQRI